MTLINIIVCPYAEDWDQDDYDAVCPHTGQHSCVDPICPMLQTGDAYIDEIDEKELG